MSTRKIARLGLLIAACVIGRILFQFIPNVQPMTAIFLFTVYYLGIADGLLVMSLSVLLSNFYFGMGPWLFGQLISYSLVLILFSVCSRKLKAGKNQWLMAGLFFFAGMFYGGFTACYDTVVYQLPHLWVYYLQGVSFDLMHSVGNVAFFIVFAPVIHRMSKEFSEKV
ncbi:hypothetical protein D920_02127 [Enterococcus faecalis 13-SD-W-01]|nr:hypothetical protein D920_02127 [Enterococcus faecalis 13-SD-W-01]